MRLQTFSTNSDFISAAVYRVAELCASKSGTLYVAISGGKTPQPIYQALAQSSVVDLDRIEWYLVDERYVPLDHSDSNYKMIMEAFGAAQPEFSEHFHYFDTALAPDEAARQYEEELKKIPAQKFDLIFLGIGNDGHTASLFPKSRTLNESQRLAMATINELAPNPSVRERLTITWPVILQSREVVALVSGAEKQGIIDELFQGTKDDSEVPVKRLLKHSASTIYYLSS